MVDGCHLFTYHYASPMSDAAFVASRKDDHFSRLLPAIDVFVEYRRKLPVNGS